MIFKQIYFGVDESHSSITNYIRSHCPLPIRSHDVI